MSNPIAFNEFDFDGYAVRTVIDEDSEVWFVAKDVADILGYAKTNNMTERLDDEEKRTLYIAASQNNQTLINESGLYNAVMGSQKEEAKRFKRWVTSEVLPSIRKTGGYSLTPKTYSEALFVAAQQAKRAEEAELLAGKRDLQFKSVRGAYGNHVMQHNKYVHSKG